MTLIYKNILQEKNNLEIDLNYKLKMLQQRLEQEINEHNINKARLTDKHQSIEEAKSIAMCGKFSLLGMYKIKILLVFEVLFLLLITVG